MPKRQPTRKAKRPLPTEVLDSTSEEGEREEEEVESSEDEPQPPKKKPRKKKGEERVKCNVCGADLAPDSLRGHMRTQHTVIPHYICEVCKKVAFTGPMELQRHYRDVHPGEDCPSKETIRKKGVRMSREDKLGMKTAGPPPSAAAGSSSGPSTSAEPARPTEDPQIRYPAPQPPFPSLEDYLGKGTQEPYVLSFPQSDVTVTGLWPGRSRSISGLRHDIIVAVNRYRMAMLRMEEDVLLAAAADPEAAVDGGDDGGDGGDGGSGDGGEPGGEEESDGGETGGGGGGGGVCGVGAGRWVVVLERMEETGGDGNGDGDDDVNSGNGDDGDNEGGEEEEDGAEDGGDEREKTEEEEEEEKEEVPERVMVKLPIRLYLDGDQVVYKAGECSTGDSQTETAEHSSDMDDGFFFGDIYEEIPEGDLVIDEDA